MQATCLSIWATDAARKPDGFASSRWVSSAVGEGPSGIAAIDLNGDGKADIVTGNWESGDVSVVFSR